MRKIVEKFSLRHSLYTCNC